MNQENFNSGNDQLGALLRAARPSPSLPPRFQEGVWRRIEEAKAPGRSADDVTWLDALAALVLRPRFAFATVSALVLAGVLLGTYNGNRVARQEAEAHYLAVVAPNSLR